MDKSFREFLLEEIITEDNKEKYSKIMTKLVDDLKNIRHDVRVYIKCYIINEFWKKYNYADYERLRND